MSSLYKRATPAQHQVLRIVEGAVRNAAHAHPEYQITDHFARSIAKRAAGTLSSQWPAVLAARSVPSDRSGRQPARNDRSTASHSAKMPSVTDLGQSPKGRRHRYVRRRPGSPLVSLWGQISCMIRPAKDRGQTERVAVLIEVLRMISALQEKK
jgi:hypothetical protein